MQMPSFRVFLQILLNDDPALVTGDFSWWTDNLSVTERIEYAVYISHEVGRVPHYACVGRWELFKSQGT